MNTISIIGCGWLGLPLGISLMEDGYQIKGSSTNPDKMKTLSLAGIEPYKIKIEDKILADETIDGFFSTDLLIINIPPSRNKENLIDYYSQQINIIAGKAREHGIDKIIFISSTSVYAPVNTEVIEEDAIQPLKPSGKAILKTEQMLMSDPAFSTTVLRFCGLVGPERHPGNFFKNGYIKDGNSPINLIHLDDCINIIREIIKQEVWSGVYNACAGAHPKKKVFYPKACRSIGRDLPKIEEGKFDFKIVNSDKLRKKLKYHFIYDKIEDAFNKS